MPKGVDHSVWERAKKQAAKQGHSEDWDYVMSIYQSMMKGKKKEKYLEARREKRK